MQEHFTAWTVAKYLNEVLALDPKAITEMFRSSHVIVKQLADSDRIVCGIVAAKIDCSGEPVYDTSPMGLVNGLLMTMRDPNIRVAYIFDEEIELIKEFKVVNLGTLTGRG